MTKLRIGTLVLATAVAGMALVAAGARADVNPPLGALGPPSAPPDNPTTPAKVALGKLLFFDTRLSGDASVSCATCHEPKSGWADPGEISRGYPGTVHWRNSQTVVNTVYYNKLFWAGAAKSLEAQAPGAAKGAVAGNGESDMMEARLAFIPEYRKRFRAVFGDEWPQLSNAWRAIAAFERSLVQTDTPFDRYMRGDKGALDAAAQRGMKLFTGKANCIECHNGPFLTDQKFYNLGVPRAVPWMESGLAQITFRYEQYAKGVPESMYRSVKDDAGLYYRTKENGDKGKFRTPTLRYLAFTVPYMHNGAFFDLDEVLEFYNEGGGKNEFSANKTGLLKPLDLTDEEMDDIVAFLEALSGEEIKMVAPKLPQYAPLPRQ